MNYDHVHILFLQITSYSLITKKKTMPNILTLPQEREIKILEKENGRIHSLVHIWMITPSQLPIS
jgi:hypothetical protein